MSASKTSASLHGSRETYNQVFDSIVNKSGELRSRGYAEAVARSKSPVNLTVTSRSQLPSEQVSELIRSNASKDMKSINYDVKFKPSAAGQTGVFTSTTWSANKSTNNKHSPAKNSQQDEPQSYEEFVQTKVQAHLEKIRNSAEKRHAEYDGGDELQSPSNNDIHISEVVGQDSEPVFQVEHSFGGEAQETVRSDVAEPLGFPKAPKTSMINTENLSKNSFIQTKYSSLLQNAPRIRKETLKFAAERIDPPQVLLDALDTVFALLQGLYAPLDPAFFSLDRKKYYHYKPLLKNTAALFGALQSIQENPSLSAGNIPLVRQQLAKYHKSAKQLTTEKQYTEHVKELVGFAEWVTDLLALAQVN